jgi:hypothetical protein
VTGSRARVRQSLRQVDGRARSRVGTVRVRALACHRRMPPGPRLRGRLRPGSDLVPRNDPCGSSDCGLYQTMILNVSTSGFSRAAFAPLGAKALSRRLWGQGSDGRVSHRFEPVILVLTLLVVPVVIVEESNAPHAMKTIAAGTNWLIWIGFLAERSSSSGSRRAGGRRSARTGSRRGSSCSRRRSSRPCLERSGSRG